MSSLSSSGSSTLIVPGHDEYIAHLVWPQPPYFKGHKRTPSPTPHPDADVPRKPEQPRSARTIQRTREPHQCALGLKCTCQIKSLVYHKMKAIHLTAKTMELHLPVHPYPGGNHSLKYYRNVCESLAEMLGWREIDFRDVLKEIQSPDYWEAEKKYLENPGCLEQRHRMLPSTASADISSSASAVPASDDITSHAGNLAEECLEPTQQGRRLLGEAVAFTDGLSAVGPHPFQAPLQGDRSQTQLSTLPVSPAKSHSRWLYSNRKKPPETSPTKTSRDLIQERQYTGLGRRVLAGKMTADDGAASKKRRLSQSQSLNSDHRYREQRRLPPINASAPSLETTRDPPRYYQRARKHISRFESPEAKSSLRPRTLIACFSQSGIDSIMR